MNVTDVVDQGTLVAILSETHFAAKQTFHQFVMMYRPLMYTPILPDIERSSTEATLECLKEKKGGLVSLDEW